MRSQNRFIPDTISGISTNSIHPQMLNNQSGIGYQSDSIDHLASQILKGRALRLRQQQEVKQIHPSIDHISEKSPALKDSKQSVLPNNIQIKRSDVSNQPETKKSIQKGVQLIIIERQEISPKKQKRFLTQQSELNQSNQKLIYHQLENKQPSSKKDGSSKNDPIIMMQTEKEDAVALPEQQNMNQHQDGQDSRFELPKIDKINNQQVEHSLSQNQKSLKFAASLAPYEANSDYFQLGMDISKKIRQKQRSISQHHQQQDSRIYQVNVYQSSPVQSDISHRQSCVDISDNLEDKKSVINRDETDEEVVQALTDRLNQINEIEEAEALSKKRQSAKNEYNNSFIGSNHQLDIKAEKDMAIFGSYIETEYTQDIRDLKILEHHYESNLHYLENQTNTMLQILEALILDMQCIEYRGRVKEKQLANRRYKINLRTASYSRRFNFHSPIPRNNNVPLQFIKKFKVSPNLADKYYEIVQQIQHEKKVQKQLTDEYKIFCNYFELMKDKKLPCSYPPLPFEMEFDSNMKKYIMVSKMNNNNQKLKSKESYQFTKSKRIIQIDNTQVNYNDMLTYKIDICKDAILEYQVFKLGKIKKLKDENQILLKQIDFIDQKIQQIDKKIRLETIPTHLKGFRKSQNIIKTKSSLFMSPIIKNSQQISPYHKTFYNNRIDISQRKKISVINTNNNIQSNKNRSIKKINSSNLDNKQVPVRTVSPKHTLNKSKIIQQIQDDYGLSNIQIQNQIKQDIHTFGCRRSQQLIHGMKSLEIKNNHSSSKNKNRKIFIELNKKLLTRTQVKIDQSKSKQKVQRMPRNNKNASKQIKHTKTEPSNSINQINGTLANLF